MQARGIVDQLPAATSEETQKAGNTMQKRSTEIHFVRADDQTPTNMTNKTKAGNSRENVINRVGGAAPPETEVVSTIRPGSSKPGGSSVGPGPDSESLNGRTLR